MTKPAPIQIAHAMLSTPAAAEPEITRLLAEALIEATAEVERLRSIVGAVGDSDAYPAAPHVALVPIRVELDEYGRRASIFGYGEQGQRAIVGIDQGVRSESDFYATLGHNVFRTAQGLPVVYTPKGPYQ